MPGLFFLPFIALDKDYEMLSGSAGQHLGAAGPAFIARYIALGADLLATDRKIHSTLSFGNLPFKVSIRPSDSGQEEPVDAPPERTIERLQHVRDRRSRPRRHGLRFGRCGRSPHEFD